jgi:acetolactate synthase small subunit
MKELIFNWLKRILAILMLVTAAFAAYEYTVIRIEGYPREMHLMDQQYRIIPIHLEKRTATHLHITRRDTQRFYVYKIEDLHPMSQWQIRLYPITSSLTKGDTKPSTHAEQTLAARDRLIEATEKLQAKIEGSESDVSARSLEQKLAGNLQKIRNFEARLDGYDIDYKPYKHVDNTGGLVERLSGLLDRIANIEDPTAE